MAITVQSICRHPVKGLSPEGLEAAQIAPGAGLPDDRRFALARPATQFDAQAPRWLPKTSFYMLMRDERLAALTTRFDEAAGLLTIGRGGREVAKGRITEPLGRAIVEDFFAAYLGAAAGGKPRLIEAPSGHMFSDHQDPVLALRFRDHLDALRLVQRHWLLDQDVFTRLETIHRHRMMHMVGDDN